MQELHHLILGQFLVSLLMGLGALCLFVWAAVSGLLRDVEPVKYQVSIRRASVMSGDGRGSGPDEVETFAQGEVHSYHGIVNRWLLAVYGVLAVWGVYYLIRYWGGLGRARPVTTVRLLAGPAAVNLVVLLTDLLYNVLRGLLPLAR